MEIDTSRHNLLAAVLRRRSEIVERIVVRIRAIGGASSLIDAEYLRGVHQAVEAAVDHTIEAFAESEDRPLSIPTAILAQARLAARHQTPLETVLRRYLAGHTVLGDFLAEEAERQGVAPMLLRRALRSLAAETDRVVAEISLTYRKEDEAARPVSGDWLRATRVRRLLNGELVDPTGVSYGLDRWHVGVVATESIGSETLGALIARSDAARLIVAGDDGLIWGWLGFREKPAPLLITLVPATAPLDCRRVGIGEPARGRGGWRLTHQQARAALSVALRGERAVVRYADAALLAAALCDELLATSLRSLYLEPLDSGKDGGEVLRGTLRAYLDADRNASSTAAALGVSRNTVNNRLRAIESRLGHLRPSILGDLELALKLDDLS